MVRFTKAGLFFKFTFLSLSHLNTPLCSYNQTNWSISIIHLGSLVTVLHKEIPPKSLFSSSWTRCFSPGETFHHSSKRQKNEFVQTTRHVQMPSIKNMIYSTAKTAVLVCCCTACLSSVSLSSYPGKNMVVATFKFCTFNKPHKPSCFKQLGFLAGLPHSLTVYSVFFPLSLYSFSLLRMKCNSFRMISVVSESHFT